MWTLASTRQPALYKAWPSPKVCPSVVSSTHSLQTDPHLSKQLISLHAIVSFHVSHHAAYFSPQPRTLHVPYLSFICFCFFRLIVTSSSSLHPRAQLPDCTLSFPPNKILKVHPQLKFHLCTPHPDVDGGSTSHQGKNSTQRKHTSPCRSYGVIPASGRPSNQASSEFDTPPCLFNQNHVFVWLRQVSLHAPRTCRTCRELGLQRGGKFSWKVKQGNFGNIPQLICSN